MFACACRELVGKFIPEAIGKEIEKACQGIYPLQASGRERAAGAGRRGDGRQRGGTRNEAAPTAAAGGSAGVAGAAAQRRLLRAAAQRCCVALTPAPLPLLPPSLPQNTFVRKVKLLRSPKFDINRLMEVGGWAGGAVALQQQGLPA